MFNKFIYTIIFSTIFPYSIHTISGDIDKFSSMDVGSFLNNNFNNIKLRDETFYRLSFIQYPANIRFGEILYQKAFKNYLFSTKINTLDFGTFNNSSNNTFSASENNLEITIIKNTSSNLSYGTSIGYSWSSISSYSSSLINYNFGFYQSLFNNHLNIGMSIENNYHIINQYANIEEKYDPIKKISIQFKPKHLSAYIMTNYVYHDIHHSQLILASKFILNNFSHIYIGKGFYLNNHNNTYSIFDDLASGISIFIKDIYKINLGVQYKSAGVLNIGTSFSKLIK